jgi:nicotinate-nucleotide adenylyltransferase
MNIGVLGGTFDPIHNGHLIIAEEARKWLNLSGVIFVPAGQPWLKMDSLISTAEHRVNMVKLAIADKPHFELSTMEIERPGPSYTVDTLAELRDRLAEEDELFLILGWDNLAELPQWQEPSTLITQCHVVAVSRPDFPRPNLKKLEADFPGIAKRVMIMDKLMLDVSSSEIRDRVARGLSIHHLVPEAVNRYIKHYRLYIRD